MYGRSIRLVTVTLILSISCSDSHAPDDSDAGDRDADRADADVLDASTTDAASYDGPRDCSEVAGYRRCGETCPDPCPDRIRCPSYVPLCIPYEESFEQGSCVYDVGEPNGPNVPCADGRPCAVPGEAPAEDGDDAMCIPLDVCLEGREAGLPPFHCVWGDMTEVTRAPPDHACPPSADDRAPFCSGTCGSVDCPTPLCFGLSDTRAFGVCMWAGWRCYESAGPFLEGRLSACQRENDGEPCACLVPFPQPADAPFPTGYFTLASACLAYKDAYPDGVECRGSGWVEITR